MIPTDFIEQLKNDLGSREADALVSALTGSPTLSIRINPGKPTRLPAELDGEPVEWLFTGRRLSERPSFTLMPELHAGAFYVQDASSMILTEVISRLAPQLPAGSAVLDACAAPGGKSIAALDALPDDCLLVANEFDRKRANILQENLSKWGAPNIVVTQGDTSRYRSLRSNFQLIICDAPCSGEGMMRKDEQARSQWSPGLVKQCAALQAEILDNMWEALAPGGFLIYSTCTFNKHENELQAARLIEEYGAESVPLQLPKEWGIGSSLLPAIHALRFMPHLTRGEGLFLTVLRKPGELAAPFPSKPKKKKGDKSPQELLKQLSEAERYTLINVNEEWSAVPTPFISLISKIAETTRMLQAGLLIAAQKGRDFIPTHQLALSTAIVPQAYPRVELTHDQALDYLRGNPQTLPAATPRGYVIVTYNSLPLGFLKNLGNRTNNLYPKPWRIRL